MAARLSGCNRRIFRLTMLSTETVPDGSEKKIKLVDFIINLPLFEFLEKDELHEVADRMDFVDLDPGNVLFNEWDKADFVCFVESGELNVTKKTGPDCSAVRATLRRGRSIGEMSIINNFPRSSTVVARTQVRLAVLPREAFEEIMEEHAGIAIGILKGLANLLSVNLKKAASRLEDYMLPAG
jgi:CRP/FNR family cyclic AMP-dependent transcriptional regulator